MTNLEPLFNPRTIAVVGASADERKFGNRTVRILRKHAFAGPVYPLHPTETAIEGYAAFSTFDALPTQPELTIICLPAPAVAGAVERACAAGTRAIVVYSSGFRETGEEGGALEARIAGLAAEHNVLLLGPNCQGSANFHTRAVVNFSLAMLDPMGPPSGLAIVGQSGLLGTILTDSMKHQAGISPGVLVATGNEAQLDSLAIAGYLASQRPEIDTILLHLETIASMAAIEGAAMAASTKGKELCVLKIGRSAAGRLAATSHTGSMPVDDQVFSSVCAQLGIRQVGNIESAVRVCRTLLHSPRERSGGSRVGVVSNSGGVAALFADLISQAQLEIAALTTATKKRLADYLPGQDAGGFNPADVNVLPYSAPMRYVEVVQLLAADPDVDQLLVFIGMQRSNLQEIVHGLAQVQRQMRKPIVVCAMGCAPELPSLLKQNGVLVVTDSVAAVDALATLADSRTTSASAVPRSSGPSIGADDGALLAQSSPVSTDVHMWVAPWDETHNKVFASAGIDVLPAFFEADTARAVARGAQIGYPVAVKVFSRRHTHKSDIGGVRLNVASSGQLRSICDAYCSRLGDLVEGFIVQKMCPFEPVAEAFLGCKRDAVFGDVILLGSGGIYVNEWADARVIANPHDAVDVERAVDRLVMRPMFRPLRGQAGADVTALGSLVSRVAHFFRSLPAAVSVLEFNPVILGRPRQGAYVADWRADITSEGVEDMERADFTATSA